MGDAVLELRLPDEVVALLERDELLKSAAEALIAEELRNFLLKILALDELAKSSRLTEADIAELSKTVKRG